MYEEMQEDYSSSNPNGSLLSAIEEIEALLDDVRARALGSDDSEMEMEEGMEQEMPGDPNMEMTEEEERRYLKRG